MTLHEDLSLRSARPGCWSLFLSFLLLLLGSCRRQLWWRVTWLYVASWSQTWSGACVSGEAGAARSWKSSTSPTRSWVTSRLTWGKEGSCWVNCESAEQSWPWLTSSQNSKSRRCYSCREGRENSHKHSSMLICDASNRDVSVVAWNRSTK